MNVQKPQFEGEAEHKLDKKLRVAIPAPWRPANGGAYRLRLLKWEIDEIPILKALTDIAFEAALKSIDENPAFTSGTKARQKGVLYAYNQPVTVNDQGKMLIPKKFAEEHGFNAGSTVHFLGRGNNFDILSPANYNALMANERDIMSALSQTISFG